MPVSKKFFELDINKDEDQLRLKIKDIIDFQFGLNVFKSIFPEKKKLSFEFSKITGKIKSVSYDNKYIFRYVSISGQFNTTVEGGILLKLKLPPPKLRVVVKDEIQEFIKKGKSLFSKHIVSLDRELRNGSEVLVVNGIDELLAIGKLSIPSINYPSIPIGVGVKVRKGIVK